MRSLSFAMNKCRKIDITLSFLQVLKGFNHTVITSCTHEKEREKEKGRELLATSATILLFWVFY